MEHINLNLPDYRTGLITLDKNHQTIDDEIENAIDDLFPNENNENDENDENIQQDQENRLRWPSLDPNPIDEETTEGYMTMAFPTLFPYGTADFLFEGNHKYKVKSLAGYFDALLRYKDGRFERHPRFAFWALNTKLHAQCKEQTKMFLRRNPDVAQLTVLELNELFQQEKPQISSWIFKWMAPITGLSAYWKHKSSELSAMISQLGSPTLFFTLSAADLHWPDFHRLIDSQAHSFPLPTRINETPTIDFLVKKQ